MFILIMLIAPAPTDTFYAPTMASRGDPCNFTGGTKNSCSGNSRRAEKQYNGLEEGFAYIFI
ncbi:MAG: hypothetical protein IPP86_06720 [Bacteroidetes bacterium]|nr:hypothetical protein [Bacteroidota bacterium]